MQQKRSKLPHTTQRRPLEHFVAGTPARTTADLVGAGHNTAMLYYHKLREITAQPIEEENPSTEKSRD